MIEGKRIADGLGAIPLKQMIESIAGRAGIVLELPTMPIGEGDREVADRTGASRSSPERVPTHTRNTRGRDELTQRELEVLVLLVAGHSDGEIGDELFISKKTVVCPRREDQGQAWGAKPGRDRHGRRDARSGRPLPTQAHMMVVVSLMPGPAIGIPRTSTSFRAGRLRGLLSAIEAARSRTTTRT